MQILTTNNQNFEKLSRNPSNRTKVKILKKTLKCSSLKILAKIEGKKSKNFSKIDQVFDFGQKNSKLFQACVPFIQFSVTAYLGKVS
jgi:hypothetical protein